MVVHIYCGKAIVVVHIYCGKAIVVIHIYCGNAIVVIHIYVDRFKMRKRSEPVILKYRHYKTVTESVDCEGAESWKECNIKYR